MNLLVEGGQVIAVLSAAVALSACTITTQVPLSRSETFPTAASSIEMRSLSPTEKAALAKTLSRAVTNPNADNSNGSPSPRVAVVQSAIAGWSTSRAAVANSLVFAGSSR